MTFGEALARKSHLSPVSFISLFLLYKILASEKTLSSTDWLGRQAGPARNHSTQSRVHLSCSQQRMVPDWTLVLKDSFTQREADHPHSCSSWKTQTRAGQFSQSQISLSWFWLPSKEASECLLPLHKRASSVSKQVSSMEACPGRCVQVVMIWYLGTEIYISRNSHISIYDSPHYNYKKRVLEF